MEELEAGTVTGEESESAQTEEETRTSTEETETSTQTDEGGGEQAEEEGAGEQTEPEGRAQERIQQLANEKREMANKLAALEAKVNQVVSARDEIPAIDEQALNAHLGSLRDQIDDLRLDGNHIKADLLERQRNKIIDEYETWQQQQTARQSQQTEQQHYKKALDDTLAAANLYREHYNVPQPLWDEIGQWFSGELEKDKLLAQEFNDVMLRQGPVAAVRFAHDRAKPVFEQKAKQVAEDKKKREAAKTKQVGGEAGGTATGPKSFAQLMNLGSAQVAAFKKSNPKQYQKLLDASLK